MNHSKGTPEGQSGSTSADTPLRQYSPLPSPYTEDQIDYREFFAIFSRQRWYFASVLILCLAVSIATAFLLPRKYDATMLLAAASESQDSSGLGSLASQFGGIASLAGVNLDASGSKEEAVAVLNSRSLAGEFIEEWNLKPVFFADRWDSASSVWSVVPEEIPSTWEAINYFEKKVRRVSIRKEDGLIAMSVTWFDPVIAAEWANGLIALVNRKMRDDAITEATQSIEYLNEELSKTSAIELQQGIYRLIETNLNTIMLANVRDEFAFRVLDRATPPDPEDFSSPNRPLVVLAGAVLGFLFATGGSLIRNARPQRNKNQDQ